MIFLPLIVFVFGLFIGSFLNVVILRMNTGRSAVVGRSKCARCSRVLSWYELLPVVSFLGLRGKCRTCTMKISFQYPLVELTTAIVFTTLYIQFALGGFLTTNALISFLYSCIVASVLIVIFAYDLRHKIIPDTANYLFIILGLLSIVWHGFMTEGFLIGNAIVSGVALALPFFLLWFFSKGVLMGFGDVKLALGMGWLLGLGVGFAAVLLAFWIGAIVGLFLLAISKKHSMTSQIPFAPFLVIGTFIAGVWGVRVVDIIGVWL